MSRNIYTGKIDHNALSSLLPQAVIKFALEHEQMKAPLKQSFDTVALFADVSGFTKLSESFASKGPQGAEELAFVLNRYMEQLVRHISRAGGDVFKFAGDAMLVLWVPEEKPNKTNKEIQEELKSMTHRAIQCSIAIQQELDCAQLTPGVSLSVKIGIGVGEATVLHVGGMYNRMEYFACGMPLLKAFQSEEHATKGDIIVSYEAWEKVASAFEGKIIVSPHYKDNNKKPSKFVRILSQLETIRNKSIQAQKKQIVDVFRHFRLLLNRYIPAAVLPYLTKNNQKTWSGELRMVSILFVNIGVNLSNVNNIDKASLDWIQDVITGIQNAVYKYEGSLNKLLVDDKGTNVIAVFGVPPLAHYDDAIRAVLSALKLLRHLKTFKINCFIGVTSGLIYTGLLGGGSSREYGVLGDAVNLAARLMAKQKKTGSPGVLVDRTTQELVPHWVPVRFDELEPFHVKGKEELIYAYAAHYSENHVIHAPTVIHYYDIEHDSKLKNIEKRWNEANNNSMVLMLESPIGTGKSYFLESLTHSLSKHSNVNYVWGKAYQYMARTHLVWNAVFTTLLNRKEYTENRSYRQYVKELFTQDKNSDLLSYASLANDIFGTQFLETGKCSTLPNALRLDKKVDCCLHILRHFSKTKRLIIFLDNLQWMQQDDWQVTEFLINMVQNEQIPGVSLFMGSRPLLSELFRPRFIEPPKEYKRIRDLLKSKGQLLTLQNWDLINVRSFICEYFAVDDVQPSLVSFIYERTGGNPSFCMWVCELVNVNISHENGVMLLEFSSDSAEQVHSEAPLQVSVPIKVHSTLIGYIDRLTPSQILLLKTASTICMGQGSASILFDLDTLERIYPVSDYKENIQGDLKYLCNINIISRHRKVATSYQTSHPNVFCHNYRWMFQSSFLTSMLEVAGLKNKIKKKKQKNVKKIVFDEETGSVQNPDTSAKEKISHNNKRREKENLQLPDVKNSTNTPPSTVNNSNIHRTSLTSNLFNKKIKKTQQHLIFSTKLVHFFMNRLEIYPFNIDRGVDWKSRKIIPFNDRKKPVKLFKRNKEMLAVEYDKITYYFKSSEECIDEWFETLDNCLQNGVMTEDQEKNLTIRIEKDSETYAFNCGFFRDVIYGLMLLKQRQQLHDTCSRALEQQWTMSSKHGDVTDDESHEISCKSLRNFTHFQHDVITRHRELALKDDRATRMGSFTQSAPQHDVSTVSQKSSVSPRKQRILSVATPTMHSRNITGSQSISPHKNASVFGRFRQSLTMMTNT